MLVQRSDTSFIENLRKSAVRKRKSVENNHNSLYVSTKKRRVEIEMRNCQAKMADVIACFGSDVAYAYQEMLNETRDELDDGVDDNYCTSKLTNAPRQAPMSRQMRRDNYYGYSLSPHVSGQQPPPVSKEMQFAQAISLMVHNDTMRDLNRSTTYQTHYR